MVDTETVIMRSDFASMQVLDPDRHEVHALTRRVAELSPKVDRFRR